MSRFIIQGGQSLSGEIEVSGAKNAALKMMAAALLTDKQIYLKNVPDISDIRTMKDILVKLGAKINFDQHQMAIDCCGVKADRPDYELVKHMRGSVVIIGPLLSRFNEVVIPQPGGCLIGARSIDTHISALKQLNVTVQQDKDYFHFKTDNLEGNKVVLEEMSVTTTENVLMAAVLAKGETEIRLAAAEPEIEDLTNMLIKMGAKIKGAGTSVIKIQGVSKLHGAEHQVIPDRIEAGTFAIAAAVSRGDVRIKNINSSHIDFVLHKFKQANITFELEDNNTCLHIKPTTIFNPINVDTRPYPGFPTDLQAPMSVLLTQANGTSKIFETMYEGRIGYIKELKKMGADINAVDIHTVVINGPTPLYGKEIISFDIRAGATLIIAALIAQGESVIDQVELVDRGYEDIDGRLRKVGAKIKRVN